MSQQQKLWHSDYLKPDDLLLGVSRKGVEFFVACLTIGTLKAMRDNYLNTEVGIWTLGRPIFWNKLEKEDLISEDLLRIIQSADEIDALRELRGEDHARKMLDRLIEEVTICIDKIQEPNWYAVWGPNLSDG